MWDKFDEKVASLSHKSSAQGLGEVERGVPASDETISSIENILGLNFPSDYRKFLGLYGGLGIGDSFFFGTWSQSIEDTRGTTVTGETLRLRSEFGMPHDLVAVFGSDYESYLCLNCSPVRSEPALVYFSILRKAIFPCEHSDSFATFVNKYVDALIGNPASVQPDMRANNFFQKIRAKFR